MTPFINACIAELLKNRRSRITWAAFVAFALAPLMGGVFMLIMKNPEAVAQSSMLKSKADMVSFQANWPSYLSLLSQAMGVGGILVFGFVASWLFGREYVEGTAKDLLALPGSRSRIVHAKFAVYTLWCLALALSNLLIGLLIGLALQLPDWGGIFQGPYFKDYIFTTLLTLLPGTPIAFFALAGRGYMAPLGAVVLTLVLSQIIAATGYGNYFPWAIPGLYSGAGGEYKALLNAGSYSVLALTCIGGYAATLWWWGNADQAK